eukprot:Nitzschia sp. Nitz4//scaffold95_size97785//17380//22751//NITZ4_004656-RA/size97785-augustus-gene-0.104-mRNA-1//-1//CDS//3329560439//9010//frame0
MGTHYFFLKQQMLVLPSCHGKQTIAMFVTLLLWTLSYLLTIAAEHADTVGASLRIINGWKTDPSQFQYYVKSKPDGYSFTDDYSCGAVLIHSDIILSAAHCQGAFNFGAYLYSNETNNFTREWMVIEQYRHPKYNYNTDYNYDVMVLKLESPVAHIVPVSVNAEASRPLIDEELVVVGLGYTETDQYPDDLREGHFRAVSTQACQDIWDYYEIMGASIGEDVLCAGPDTSESVCYGDSGGPLVSVDDPNLLLGIVSFTVSCESDDIPDGFARISYFYDWIQEHICALSSEPPAYCLEEDEPQTAAGTPSTFDTNSTTVLMKLDIMYDLFPEETTYAIRNVDSWEIEYVGPSYVVSTRFGGEEHTEYFFLSAPGQYILEVYDLRENGMMAAAGLGLPQAYWKLSAPEINSTTVFTPLVVGSGEFYQSTSSSFALDETFASYYVTEQPSMNPSMSPSTFPSNAPSSTPTIFPSFSPSSNSPALDTVKLNVNAAVAGDEPHRQKNFPASNVHPPATPRIVNGWEADPSQFQYYVKSAFNNSYLCGAVLIHSDIVLSAAHCQGAFNFGVNLYSNETNDYTRVSAITEQHRHPRYDYDYHINFDVLILKLEHPVTDIVPATFNAEPSRPLDDEELTLVGFGRTETDELPDQLLEGHFRALSSQECDDIWSSYGLWQVDIGEDVLCAGPNISESACFGDSGGPLVSAGDPNLLVGIASFTMDCQPDDIPDGFARVSYFHDWIQDYICAISSDPPDYCPQEQQEGSQTPIQSDSVLMKLDVMYDLYPEETTYFIRNYETLEIEFVGPTYVVSDRWEGEEYTEYFYLTAPGRYAIEVRDANEDGMVYAEAVGLPEAYFKLSAAMAGTTDYAVLVQGDGDFGVYTRYIFVLDESYISPTASPSMQPTDASETPSASPSTNPTDRSQTMKFEVNFVVTVAGLLTPFFPVVRGGTPAPEQFFTEQIVDHVDPYGEYAGQLWSQRYYTWEKEFQGPGSPIFLILGGEGSISPHTGIMYPFISDHLAKDFGAFVLEPEHRFYGESLPISSWDSSNLRGPDPRVRLFTSEQALLDALHLTDIVKERLGCSTDISSSNYCPVITVGGSYPGWLSAMARIVYPDRVDIAYSASAPMRFYSQQVNQYDYYQLITDVAEATIPGCSSSIRDALLQVEKVLEHPCHYNETALGICEGTTPWYIRPSGSLGGGNLENCEVKLADELMMVIAYTFANANMGNYPPSNTSRMYSACEVFMSDDLDAMGKVNSFLAPQLPPHDEACWNFTAQLPSGKHATITSGDWSGVGWGDNGESWDFQTCTLLVEAIGFSEQSMFPPRDWSLTWLQDHCYRRFRVTPRPYELVKRWQFDSDHLIQNNVTRIIFTNGLKDGWSVGGFHEDLSDSLVVLNFPNGAHHSDLSGRGPSEDDTNDIAQGFVRIKELLTQWLEEIQAPPKDTLPTDRSFAHEDLIVQEN